MLFGGNGDPVLARLKLKKCDGPLLQKLGSYHGEGEKRY
jgi:hypothetical protein